MYFQFSFALVYLLGIYVANAAHDDAIRSPQRNRKSCILPLINPRAARDRDRVAGETFSPLLSASTLAKWNRDQCLLNQQQSKKLSKVLGLDEENSDLYESLQAVADSADMGEASELREESLGVSTYKNTLARILDANEATSRAPLSWMRRQSHDHDHSGSAVAMAMVKSPRAAMVDVAGRRAKQLGKKSPLVIAHGDDGGADDDHIISHSNDDDDDDDDEGKITFLFSPHAPRNPPRSASYAYSPARHSHPNSALNKGPSPPVLGRSAPDQFQLPPPRGALTRGRSISKSFVSSNPPRRQKNIDLS